MLIINFLTTKWQFRSPGGRIFFLNLKPTYDCSFSWGKASKHLYTFLFIWIFIWSLFGAGQGRPFGRRLARGVLGYPLGHHVNDVFGWQESKLTSQQNISLGCFKGDNTEKCRCAPLPFVVPKVWIFFTKCRGAPSSKKINIDEQTKTHREYCGDWMLAGLKFDSKNLSPTWWSKLSLFSESI